MKIFVVSWVGFCCLVDFCFMVSVGWLGFFIGFWGGGLAGVLLVMVGFFAFFLLLGFSCCCYLAGGVFLFALASFLCVLG